MPTNIKILLSLMIVVAILILTGAIFSIKTGENLLAFLNIDQKNKQLKEGGTISEKLPLEISSSNSSLEDFDKDGLPDLEESIYKSDPLNPDTDGDGYLDGEEVISNCDPVIPAEEKDCVYIKYPEEESKNLTEEFADVLAGGLLSKELKVNDPNFNNVISVLQRGYLRKGEEFLNLYNQTHKIKVSKNDSPEIKRIYLSKLSEILEKEIAKNIYSDQNDFDFGKILANITNNKPISKNTAKDNFEKTQTLYTQISNLEVPKSWVDIQFKILTLVKGMGLIYESLTDYQNDPLKTLFAINKFPDLINIYRDIISDITKRIREENVSPPKNTIFYYLSIK